MISIKTTTKRRLLLLTAMILVISVYVGHNVFVYIGKINATQKEKNLLTMQLENLTEEEEVLRSEIVKLEDPEYVARFAREKYLYSKDGEKIFRIIK